MSNTITSYTTLYQQEWLLIVTSERSAYQGHVDEAC